MTGKGRASSLLRLRCGRASASLACANVLQPSLLGRSMHSPMQAIYSTKRGCQQGPVLSDAALSVRPCPLLATCHEVEVSEFGRRSCRTDHRAVDAEHSSGLTGALMRRNRGLSADPAQGSFANLARRSRFTRSGDAVPSGYGHRSLFFRVTIGTGFGCTPCRLLAPSIPSSRHATS